VGVLAFVLADFGWAILSCRNEPKGHNRKAREGRGRRKGA